MTENRQRYLPPKVSKTLEKQIKKTINSELSKKVATKTSFLGSQVKQHVTTAIVAAFSFIIALVWKDLIVSFIDFYVKDSIKSNVPYSADLLVAIIVSLIAVIGIIIVTNWAKKPVEPNPSLE